MKKYKCKICNKVFRASPSAKRIYCGKDCLNIARRCRKSPWFEGANNPNWVGGLPKCLDCNKQLSNYRNKHCRSCRQKGERSHFWKGGITPEVRRIRTSIRYKIWREAVFKRDNYTCVWCGIANKKGVGKSILLNADHIKRFAEYPELRFDIDNGRTLCVPCHRKTGTFGRLGLNV